LVGLTSPYLLVRLRGMVWFVLFEFSVRASASLVSFCTRSLEAKHEVLMWNAKVCVT